MGKDNLNYDKFGKVICPRCDKQGRIYQAKLNPIGIIAYICDECEATWFDSEKINLNNFIDLLTFLENKKLSFETCKITNKDYNWSRSQKLN